MCIVFRNLETNTSGQYKMIVDSLVLSYRIMFLVSLQLILNHLHRSELSKLFSFENIVQGTGMSVALIPSCLVAKIFPLDSDVEIKAHSTNLK